MKQADDHIRGLTWQVIIAPPEETDVYLQHPAVWKPLVKGI